MCSFAEAQLWVPCGAVGLRNMELSYLKCYFARAGVTKHHQLGGFRDKCIVSQVCKPAAQDQGVGGLIPCGLGEKDLFRAPS